MLWVSCFFRCGARGEGDGKANALQEYRSSSLLIVSQFTNATIGLFLLASDPNRTRLVSDSLLAHACHDNRVGWMFGFDRDGR